MHFSSPLEEEIGQEEAEKTQYRNELNRHTLCSLRLDSRRNLGDTGLGNCGDNLLALA